MAKYKVGFSGFVYVEAEDEESARETLLAGDYCFFEYKLTDVEEVDKFVMEV